MTYSVPILDFCSPTVIPEAQREFLDTGFIFLKNHSLCQALLSRAYAEWTEFFSQSLRMKMVYHFNPEKSGLKDGYFPLFSEHAKGISEPDLKEFYHFYLWGQLPALMAPVTKKLHNSLLEIGLEVMTWIVKDLLRNQLTRDPMDLIEMVDVSESTVTRALHYPPVDFDSTPQRLRSSAHEDVNLLTVYPAATQEGLEFLDKKGRWHKVPCDPDIIAIAIGDMLALASGGRLTATTHRVVNPQVNKNSARYAFLLFLHAKNYVQLSPEYTAASYLTQRYRENGVLKERVRKLQQPF